VVQSSNVRLVFIAGQLLIGIMIIFMILFILNFVFGLVEIERVPAGWKIIRPPNEVSSIAIDNETIWTGGKDGVILIDRKTGQRIPLAAGAPKFGYVRGLLKDRQGAIWVAHDAGLALYFQGNWTTYDQQVGRAASLLEDRNGTIWIGTDNRILLFNGTHWRTLNPPGFTISSVDVLFQDRNGEVWIGSSSPTNAGLYSFNGSIWRSYTVKNGLPHNSIRMIAQDREGALWVATGFASQGGAARFKNGVWTNLTRKDGLAGESTRSVFEDQLGRLWFGSEYDGIAVLDNDSLRILKKQDGLAGNEVKAIVQDQDGIYWMGTEGGLSQINNINFSCGCN
jgi:ligand-binding sensor domain-containing protein